MKKSPLNQNMQLGLTRHWGWLLGLGITFLILGMIGIGMSVALTLMSMFILGVLFIVAGGAQIIDAFKSKQWKAVFLHAVIGILYLIGGLLVVYDPVLASLLITMMLAWIFILIGIMRFIMAFTLRHTRSSGWIFLSGLISMILGILILLQWPASGLWIIGLFIAIELLFAGWTYIFLAFAIRKAA